MPSRHVTKMVLLLLALVTFASGQNLGTLIGQFNVYHHGISGSVYSINSSSLYLKDFNYDGTGKDAYFWGGPGSSPSAQGFIVPFRGRTNVLQKFEGDSFVLNLPEGKALSDLKWLSVYDLTKLENYGDVYIPEGFEPPKVEKLAPFVSDEVTCEYIEVLDFKTIKLVGFSYSSPDDAYFYAGKGHVPNTRGGFIVPDENGYFEPLHPYNNDDVILTLPGETTVDQIDYISIFDIRNEKSIAYINIPSELNVPPSLNEVKKHDYTFGNCEELHRDFHVSWEVNGQTINIEIVVLMGENDYAAFGLSGSNTTAQMVGSDVAIAYLKQSQVIVNDYNIDSYAMCSNLFEQPRGVCKDSELGKPDSVQALEGKRIGQLATFKYRRQITKSDDIDQGFTPGKGNSIIYAIGPMANDRPAYHRVFPRSPKKIDFGRNEESKCSPFVLGWRKEIEQWETAKIVDSKLRIFTARLGPTGGGKGKTIGPNPGIAWYIHGYLSPELFMQRGVTYSFKVEGGSNPQQLQNYHPFVITTNPLGGPNEKNYLAGVEITRRGQRRPTTAGRLCVWKHLKDPRLDDSYPTWEKYRNSLKLRCEQGEPGILELTPNSSWPDVVYYNSYNGLNMGGRIHILDSFSAANAKGSSISSSFFTTFLLCSLLPLFKLLL